MGEPALSEEVVELWADRKWRLNNLYWIEDKKGNVVKFTLNAAQEKLLDNLHYLNIILKARQLGFSTFILILALDCCLFNDHFSAGLVADTIDNAKALLKRIKFAYERIPEQIRSVVALKSDNATEMEFSNGSNIAVGVSLRSGTYNLVHISEYGKICAKYPDKAKEIKAGALNTIAPGQLVFIESTAEGRGGDFYEKTEQARRVQDGGRVPGSLEYAFHFFPWFMDPTYQSEETTVFTADDEAYFKELKEEHGINLTGPQCNWYAAKAREQGEDMWKEFPSTPDEAFKAAKEGAYFAKQIRILRQQHRIGDFPLDARSPVNTFWDWGISDYATIWFHQRLTGRDRFVGYYENCNEGPAHYANYLLEWAAKNGATFGAHYGPHDFETRRPGSHGEITTLQGIFAGLGFSFDIVTRSADKGASIQLARTRLANCEFDNACLKGVERLENYSRDWDDRLGVWKSTPRHDEHSHGADGFMTFTDGYEYREPTKRAKRTAPGSWMG